MKKKKILIWGMTPFVGGVEKYIVNILQNIDNTKFEIDLLVKDNIDGLNETRINGFYNKIYKIPKIKRHPLKVWQYIKDISRKNKYDVIHFNLGNANMIVYALPLKLFFKDSKLIFHSHNGDDAKKITHYISRPILNMIADKRIACSKTAASWMYGKRANAILLNNAIDTEKFLFNETTRNRIRKELKIEDCFVIGHIGRFDKQKNHKCLIDIFYQLKKVHQNVALMLIGSGILEEEIKKYVKELKLENEVMFLGVKDNTNEYYQAMDLFVLPSLFEGLPIVAIEAQTSGLKCILSDNIDKNTRITDNVIFLPTDNVELWKNNILKTIKLKHKRKNMMKEIINANYDLKTEIKRIEKIYVEDSKS